DEVPVQIDNLRLWPFQFLDVHGFAQSLNAIATYRDRLLAQDRTERRVRGNSRIDIRVHEDHVRFRAGSSQRLSGHRILRLQKSDAAKDHSKSRVPHPSRSLRRMEFQYCVRLMGGAAPQRCEKMLSSPEAYTPSGRQSPHHSPESPAPASASMVSRIRFSPSSRPLLSNHSCKVCAPPPDPPPPMAMASSPIDSGMFASVDARCTCAALFNCASTARITCKIRAPVANSPAGRFPMGTISQLTPEGRFCCGDRISAAI